ncbi:hypothetical protein BJ138DRAFT_1142194 [Hygrophoropsis aurantiaca]|uniref:Uncharacterized protein n=1 Tax=Hygrophoropsis aurantiaca TaxID=72124 RepID=A0ACB8APH3_9AGAM|nr:hypothetical protein BJ138DRAFT_1142194 [Hygrophoropsis aurantiaca]
MSSSSNVLSHFGVLDELVQLIYQGFEKFVLLSKADDSAWTVYLGLQGAEGRWWRGSWSANDILHIAGSKSNTKLLEAFADKLTDTIVQGDLAVGNWSADKDADISLTLGPTSKKPLHLSLIELSSEEAAAHATAVFIEIALQAKSRKCHLNPSSSTSYSSSVPPDPPKARSVLPKKISRIPSPKPPIDHDAQDKIKALQAELALAKKASRNSPSGEQSKPAVPRPLKGASLANPNKKARKYQALEFESDEE